MRVVCAMSGGVDSSVTASLLLEQGHEVIGMTMSLYDASQSVRKGRGGSCCSPAEVDLAKRVCDQLGIAHYTVDERDRFREEVIDDFVREYAAGRTPNPCARCNQHIKFGPLLRRASALGADTMATGHYARIEDGKLMRAADPAKDQSYFLFAMGKEALSRVWFPLGEWSKTKVREHAEGMTLPNHDAPDSQELCFVPEGDHADVVEKRARELGLDTSALAPGEIRDTEGRVLGEHRGIHRVTVGQRRGLGVSSDKPRYVLQVLPEERVVVVGDPTALSKTHLRVENVQPLVDLDEGEERSLHVQIRHRSPAAPAMVRFADGGADVTFETAVNAVSPGQAAVFYDGDTVLGGGWIV